MRTSASAAASPEPLHLAILALTFSVTFLGMQNTGSTSSNPAYRKSDRPARPKTVCQTSATSSGRSAMPPLSVSCASEERDGSGVSEGEGERGRVTDLGGEDEGGQLGAVDPVSSTEDLQRR